MRRRAFDGSARFSRESMPSDRLAKCARRVAFGVRISPWFLHADEWRERLRRRRPRRRPRSSSHLRQGRRPRGGIQRRRSLLGRSTSRLRPLRGSAAIRRRRSGDDAGGNCFAAGCRAIGRCDDRTFRCGCGHHPHRPAGGARRMCRSSSGKKERHDRSGGGRLGSWHPMRSSREQYLLARCTPSGYLIQVEPRGPFAGVEGGGIDLLVTSRSSE